VNSQGNGTARWSCPNKIISPEALPREVTMSADGKRVLFEPVWASKKYCLSHLYIQMDEQAELG